LNGPRLIFLLFSTVGPIYFPFTLSLILNWAGLFSFSSDLFRTLDWLQDSFIRDGGPRLNLLSSFKSRFTSSVRFLQDVSLRIKLRVCALRVVHTRPSDCPVDYLAEIHAGGYSRRPELRPSDQVDSAVSPRCQEHIYSI
jgi:hypothetical protein